MIYIYGDCAGIQGKGAHIVAQIGYTAVCIGNKKRELRDTGPFLRVFLAGASLTDEGYKRRHWGMYLKFPKMKIEIGKGK